MLLTMIQSFLVPKQSFKSSGLYYPVQSDTLNTTRSSPSLSFSTVSASLIAPFLPLVSERADYVRKLEENLKSLEIAKIQLESDYEVIKNKVESGGEPRKRKSRWADDEPKPLSTSLLIYLLGRVGKAQLIIAGPCVCFRRQLRFIFTNCLAVLQVATNISLELLGFMISAYDLYELFMYGLSMNLWILGTLFFLLKHRFGAFPSGLYSTLKCSCGTEMILGQVAQS
nr:hypothetical protein CFP56_65816 [Quercus suber]